MKMKKILAASTAALLAFGTSAVVASATSVELEYSKDWEDIATVGGAKVQYKVTEANAKKLKDLSIDATLCAAQATLADASDDIYKAKDADGAGSPAANGALKDLKASQVTKLATAAANGAIAIDLEVTAEDDDDYGDREKFTVPAPISINVTDLTFEANHVYHYENKKLVEVKVDKLTDKEASGTKKYGIQFTTKSFSPFIITKDAVKGAVALDDEENPANESGTSSAATSNSGSSTTNPDTGIALAIAPVVLAAGAVAVVALKKRH